MLEVRSADLVHLRGVVLAMKAAPRDVRNAINKATRAELNPIWRDELGQRVARLPQPDAIILGKGARVKAGNPSQLMAANSTRALSGGLIPTRSAKGFEFGVNDRNTYHEYRRKNRRNSGSHTVRRRTMRQMPNRRKEGHAIWPAAAESLPRVVSLQVQTVVRLLNEKLEGKG